jgi:hypothetical protein
VPDDTLRIELGRHGRHQGFGNWCEIDHHEAPCEAERALIALNRADAALTLIADKMDEWEATTRAAGVWNPKDADAVMALWVRATAARGLSRNPSLEKK